MIEKTTNAFNIQLNTSHFGEYHLNELTVKVVDNNIEIHGKQDWRPYPGGSLKREFTQRHILPNDVDPDSLVASVTKDGILLIKAPFKPLSSYLCFDGDANKVEDTIKNLMKGTEAKYERDVPLSVIDLSP